MSSSLADFAPAIGGIIAGAVGLFFVWMAVREARSGPARSTNSKTAKPDSAGR